MAKKTGAHGATRSAARRRKGQLMGEPVRKRVVIRCPNPECDPEDGCCMCEHTGRIYEDTINVFADEYSRTPPTSGSEG